MPYAHHKTGKNEVTVTKKDSGKVVGHTTPGKLNDYLAALHIHAGDKNMAYGGMAQGGHPSLENIDPKLIAAALGRFLQEEKEEGEY